MARGKYKPTRGGGKSFSRNLQPLDEFGNETNTPDRWVPPNRRKAEESSDDSAAEEEAKNAAALAALDAENSNSGDSDSDDELGYSNTQKSTTTLNQKEQKGEAQKEPKKIVQKETKIDNPNRQPPKQVSAKELANRPPAEMSRREREEAEKKAAKERYWKLHQAGKTDEGESCMVRYSIITKNIFSKG